MKLYINHLLCNGVAATVQLRRARHEAAATLTASLWLAPADTYFQKAELAIGHSVRLLDDDGTERFLGSIHTLERTPERVDITAYDKGVYLTRNELCGVYYGTGADICRQVAKALGISVGTLDAEMQKKAIVTGAGESAFSVLRKAAGPDREISIETDKLHITKSRPVSFLLPTEQVLSVSSSASLESMVNRCTVVNYKGVPLSTAENTVDTAAYGVFHTVLGKSGDASVQAHNALHGRSMTANVVLSGNTGYRCGAYIKGSHSTWGLTGNYLIVAVEHSWRAGFFTTELTLEGVL